MASSDSQNPRPNEWRALFRQTIFEISSPEVRMRRSVAEGAIIEHMIELFRKTGADVEGEREAMDDAMHALEALYADLSIGIGPVFQF